MHVVAGLAVGAAALAAGVGVDHAADGRAVGGRQFGGEEQSMGLQGCVELILDHAALDSHPTLFDVDLQHLVHVPGQVHHQAIGQRLAVGAGAAAAWGQHYTAMFRLAGQAGQELHVSLVPREYGGLGLALIDRVVRGQHRAHGVVVDDLALEACTFELTQQRLIGREGSFLAGQFGDHGSRNPAGQWICIRNRHVCNGRGAR